MREENENTKWTQGWSLLRVILASVYWGHVSSTRIGIACLIQKDNIVLQNSFQGAGCQTVAQVCESSTLWSPLTSLGTEVFKENIRNWELESVQLGTVPDISFHTLTEVERSSWVWSQIHSPKSQSDALYVLSNPWSLIWNSLIGFSIYFKCEVIMNLQKTAKTETEQNKRGKWTWAHGS